MQDYYTKRIRTQWRLTALNLLAALINFAVFAQDPTVWTVINLLAGTFSLWVAQRCFRDIQRTHQERSEAITRILRTDFG